MYSLCIEPLLFLCYASYIERKIKNKYGYEVKCNINRYNRMIEFKVVMKGHWVYKDNNDFANRSIETEIETESKCNLYLFDDKYYNTYSIYHYDNKIDDIARYKEKIEEMMGLFKIYEVNIDSHIAWESTKDNKIRRYDINLLHDSYPPVKDNPRLIGAFPGLGCLGSATPTFF
jgi:hypothetical protein